MKREHHRFITRHTGDGHRVLSPSSGKRLEDVEFRPIVKSILESLLTDFDIFDFTANISWSKAENIRHQPDLMMVSKNRKVWIVVEVEMSDHVLGYSYASEDHQASHHIYPQVEVFAEGLYGKDHIRKISEILKEPESNLQNLLLNPPDVLVIGDNQDVLRLEERYNWGRLEDDYENVHLGFIETFKWPELETESCITYSGWLPNSSHGQKKIRLVKDIIWPSSLTPINNEGEIPLDDGLNLIQIDGNLTTWKFRKQDSVIMAVCPWSLNWYQVNKGAKVFEVTVGPTEVTIRKVM